MHTHTQMHTHTCTHTCARVHTHTHTHTEFYLFFVCCFISQPKLHFPLPPLFPLLLPFSPDPLFLFPFIKDLVHQGPHPWYLTAVAIPGCQLDYIWNELQFRIGRLTCDSNLEAKRYKFLTWILTWRSWGMVTMNSRRLKQGDLWVQSHLGLNSWWYRPLIWATSSAENLQKDIGRRKI